LPPAANRWMDFVPPPRSWARDDRAGLQQTHTGVTMPRISPIRRRNINGQTHPLIWRCPRGIERAHPRWKWTRVEPSRLGDADVGRRRPPAGTGAVDERRGHDAPLAWPLPRTVGARFDRRRYEIHGGAASAERNRAEAWPATIAELMSGSGDRPPPAPRDRGNRLSAHNRVIGDPGATRASRLSCPVPSRFHGACDNLIRPSPRRAGRPEDRGQGVRGDRGGARPGDGDRIDRQP
jgi:hypothetical protein